jgi:hypothetical protein
VPHWFAVKSLLNSSAAASKTIHCQEKGSLSPTGASVALTLASGRGAKNHHLLTQSSRLVRSSRCSVRCPFLCLSPPGLFHRDFSEGHALDGGPNDGQATHFSREHIDLVGPLTNVALRDSRWSIVNLIKMVEIITEKTLESGCPGYLDYPFQNKRFGHGSLAHFSSLQHLIFSKALVCRTDDPSSQDRVASL